MPCAQTWKFGGSIACTAAFFLLHRHGKTEKGCNARVCDKMIQCPFSTDNGGLSAHLSPALLTAWQHPPACDHMWCPRLSDLQPGAPRP
eukprot:366286-Chlamydomonas_euryale.AAC.14